MGHHLDVVAFHKVLIGDSYTRRAGGKGDNMLRVLGLFHIARANLRVSRVLKLRLVFNYKGKETIRNETKVSRWVNIEVGI